MGGNFGKPLKKMSGGNFGRLDSGSAPPPTGKELFKFTIPGGTLVKSFPFVISSRDIPQKFWDEAGDGSSLVIKNDEGKEARRDIAFIDTTQKELRIHVLIDREATDNTYTVFTGGTPSLTGQIFNSNYHAIIPLQTNNRNFITDLSQYNYSVAVGSDVTANILGAFFGGDSGQSVVGITLSEALTTMHTTVVAKSSMSSDYTLASFDDGRGIYSDNGNNISTWNSRDGWLRSGVSQSLTDFFHAASTFIARNKRHIWYNGVLKATDNYATEEEQSLFTIGRKPNRTQTPQFVGQIKEVRISTVLREDEYLQLEMLNMMNVNDYVIS